MSNRGNLIGCIISSVAGILVFCVAGGTTVNVDNSTLIGTEHAIHTSGNANVTVNGGTLTGTPHCVVATGTSTVTILGTSVRGDASTTGFATVMGI